MTIDGYNLHRADRREGRGRVVCVFSSIGIPCERRFDLESPDFECLWLWLRSYRLPKTVTGIALCAVYNAPGKSAEKQRNLCDYIIRTSDFVRNQHPDSALVFLGDFNQLDVSDTTSHLDLNQIVDSPTRGVNTFDLIICNIQNLDEKPVIFAPLETSDHNVVHWTPKGSHLNRATAPSPPKRYTRSFPRSGLEAFERQIYGLLMLTNNLTDSLTTTLTTAVNLFLQLKPIKFHTSDKPWISHAIKSLIRKRQKTFNNHDPVLWRHYKNKVKKEISKRKKAFYEDRIKHLKNEDCRKWWRSVNSLSGRRNKSQTLTIEKGGSALTDFELAEHYSICQ